MPNLAAGPVTIGPRRRSVQVVALALTAGLAACGAAKTQTIRPPARATPPHGRVPTSARVLTVTRGYPGRAPSLSLTTTSRNKVQTIAAMLDRLRPAGPGIVNCPNIPVAPTVTFTFRTRQGEPALAQASTLASGPHGECPGVMFKIPGRARQDLSARPAFLRNAGRVLGAVLVSK